MSKLTPIKSLKLNNIGKNLEEFEVENDLETQDSSFSKHRLTVFEPNDAYGCLVPTEQNFKKSSSLGGPSLMGGGLASRYKHNNISQESIRESKADLDNAAASTVVGGTLDDQTEKDQFIKEDNDFKKLMEEL